MLSRRSLFGWLVGGMVCGLLLGLWVLQGHSQEGRLIGIGDPFPQVPLPAPEPAEQRRYLGLPATAERFTLQQVNAEVVLVEILNVLCPHCRKQTAPYNRLHQRLEADPATRGRVKLLGVAVANTPEQIADFVDIYEVTMPVIPDREFALHRAIGGSRTPFSIYVRQRSGQPGIVAGTHMGLDEREEPLHDFLAELTGMDPGSFVGLPPDEAERVVVAPVLPTTELADRVRSAFAALGGEPSDFKALTLASGRQVFTARVGSERFFAEVASRPSICDVCHDVHFFYLFDRQGQVLAFEALQLTKYGNAAWDAADLARMRSRVLGRKLAGAWAFDPRVDAVSSATMTAAIIFDQLGRGESLLAELRRAGLR